MRVAAAELLPLLASYDCSMLFSASDENYTVRL